MTSHTREQGSSRIVPILMLVGLACAVAVAAGLYFNGLGPSETAAESAPPASITVSSEVLDFGLVPVNGTEARRLVIRNDGDVVVPVQLRPSVDRYDVEPRELVLQPGSREVVVVTARPDSPGELDDQLDIFAGEDTDASPLVVSLLGQVDEIRLAQANGTSRPASPGGRNAGGNGQPASTRSGGWSEERSGNVAPQADWQAGDAAAGTQGVKQADGTVAVAHVGSVGAADSGTPGSDSGTEGRRRSNRRSLDPSRANNTVPMTSTPFVNQAPVITREITEDDKAAARKLPSRSPELDELDSLPTDEPADDRDPRDLDRQGDDERDPFDDEFDENDEGEDEPEEDDPFVHPKFVVSSASSVVVLGSVNQFYPQELGVMGTDMGGPITFTQPLQLPLVPLAFGESMQFAQTGMFAGAFDPGTGQVNLQLDLVIVDSDGHSAPLPMTLTTGTVYGRSESGQVIGIVGSPRIPGTGFLKLVGVQEVPLGYGNGAEGTLVSVEILGALTFGTQAMPTAQAMGP